MVRVQNRKAETLCDVLRKNILPGSIVKTDAWRAYARLAEDKFQHDVVNHSRDFVKPQDPLTHTQNIEAYWSSIKRDMRRRVGRMSIQTYETYLVEYVWRSRNGTRPTEKDLWEDFCAAIRFFYPQ